MTAKAKGPRITLSEFCELIVDCEHKTAPTESEDTGYYSVRTPNIGRGRLILDDVNFVSQETYKAWSRRAIPQADDLILAREAPVGNVAIIPKGVNVCLGQRTVLIRPDPNKVDPNYLVYLLNGDEIQGKFHGFAAGATVPHLNMGDIRSLEMPELPERNLQVTIANILSAYDDLIENNTRRIAILEEMAQALYREWFVYFRFPGHEDVPLVEVDGGNGVGRNGKTKIPQGWQSLQVEELLEYHIGGSWGKAKPKKEFSVPVFVIRGTDIPGARYLETRDVPFRYLKQSYYDSRALKPGDIIFEVSGGSTDQPVGRALLVSRQLLSSFHEKVICASFCKLLRVNSKLLVPELFYLHLDEIYENRQIEKYQVQSTGIKNFKFSFFLEKHRITVPPKEIQNLFLNQVRSMFDMIQTLGKKTENLRQTRDLLLPRLISGRLDVSHLPLPTTTEAAAP